MTAATWEAAGPVRRPARGVEVRAGMAPAGRAPAVVAGDDLFLVLAHPGARVRCRRRTDAVPPALVQVVDAGEVLAVEVPAAAPFRAVYLNRGLLDEVAARFRAAAMAEGGERCMACVAAGEGLCEAADAIDGQEALARFVERVLGGAPRMRVPADERVEHAVVRRVRDHLRAHFARKVPLDELGRVAGMCKYALVRAFSKEIGLPPHAYQTHLRVLRARSLIAAGRRLSDVALEVGFTDQSHLNRNFKRIVGVTPGAYARLAFAAA